MWLRDSPPLWLVQSKVTRNPNTSLSQSQRLMIAQLCWQFSDTQAPLKLPLAWGETILIPGKGPQLSQYRKGSRNHSSFDSASGVLGALGSVQNPWHYTSLCCMLLWKMRIKHIFLQITFCVWSVETFRVSVWMVSWAWTSSMRSPASLNSFEYSAIANCPVALWAATLCPGTAAELRTLLGQLPITSQLFPQ